MSGQYVKFVIRCGGNEITCTHRADAYQIFNLWAKEASEEEVILVRIDTYEEVLDIQ